MAQQKNSVIKGQNLRVMVGSKCIAFATSCSLEVKANLEDASTKDSTGGWDEQELTGMSWSMSVDALYSAGGPETDALNGNEMLDTVLAGSKVTLLFARTTGDKNRSLCVIGTGITTDAEQVQYTGDAWVDSVSVKSDNKSNVTYSASFTGNGELKKVNTTA